MLMRNPRHTYLLIAQVIRWKRTPTTRDVIDDLTADLASVLALHDPNFNRRVFLAIAKVGEEKEGSREPSTESLLSIPDDEDAGITAPVDIDSLLQLE